MESLFKNKIRALLEARSWLQRMIVSGGCKISPTKKTVVRVQIGYKPVNKMKIYRMLKNAKTFD